MSEDVDDNEDLPSLYPRGTEVAERYSIIELLGEGGMGAVYRAEQRPLKRQVALKVIHPDKRMIAKARARFLREARVSAAIHHPGVVSVYDYGEFDGGLFIAMELLGGPALREIVDEDLPLLPIPRVVNIVATIAETLSIAAGHDLVHRDLKPENVLFDGFGTDHERLVLVDFGLAFHSDGDDETGRLTREGVLTGTPEYMSPEQCRGSLEVNAASDVYALGIMFYEMLTGVTPFRGETALVISRHLFVSPKKVTDVAPERSIPGVLEDMVRSMLEKNPADRPSAARIAHELSDFQETALRSGPSSSPLAGRAARMVPEAAAPSHAVQPTSVSVHFLGTLSDDIALALAANGIQLVAYPDASIVAVPAHLSDQISRIRSEQKRVLAESEPGDMTMLTNLLRAGADEVVALGSGPEEWARKLKRIARKRSP